MDGGSAYLRAARHETQVLQPLACASRDFGNAQVGVARDRVAQLDDQAIGGIVGIGLRR